ncbi:NUDIX domain-containing protein [Nocardia otitidiscaviarum]|nr:NUDIX domain-containing protein [Nocardia otitidiscaviarum]MBF6134667.1 NUDIX domain-containing protein [Nocardia otitidiscaviarum]MBF6485707.1 NUDIX domain-containing protein [Nocardia otitidiscaviarum]
MSVEDVRRDEMWCAVWSFEVSPKLSIGESVMSELLDRAVSDGVALRLGVVIEHNGAVLLLEHDEHVAGRSPLNLPGTTVRPGEPLALAVARAVFEETGLTVVDVVRHLGSFDYLSNAGTPVRREHFAVEVANIGPVRLTNYVDHHWVRLDGDLPVTPSIRRILANYRSHSEA